jgi:preprotein translocase subunit SecB
MIAKKSPFILSDFLLLKQIVEFLPPSNKEEIDIHTVMNSYGIDIDFTVQEIQESTYQIFVKVIINPPPSGQVGYSIFSEGVGIFDFDKSIELSAEDKGDYLYYSGLPICINSIRSIISTITSNGPFGKFILPSIDLTELIKEKQESIPPKSPK